MMDSSNRTRSSGPAIAAVGVLGAVVLYGYRDSAHSLTLLAWIGVALAACYGLQVGWRGALPSGPSPKVSPEWRAAALPIGVGLSLVLTLIPTQTGFPRALLWSAGSFCISASIAFYAHTLRRHQG